MGMVLPQVSVEGYSKNSVTVWPKYFGIGSEAVISHVRTKSYFFTIGFLM